MTLLNTNHYIPHTHSSFPVPYTSVIAPKPHELYSQQRTTADPRLSSFLRSAPAALAFPPAHHPEFLPCGALGVNVDISEPMPNYNPWCSTMSTPTRQVFSADVRMRNMEPREMTEPAYEHFPPIPTHQGPANAHSSPQAMNHPMTRIRVTTHPYTRVSCRKETRPAADYTPNLALVQAYCIADGGDPAAISLLQTVFANGISTTALTRRMTRDEAREYNHGAPVQMFRVILHEDKEKRSHCRLCAIGSDEGGWKHAKDALRHLKHDHFGLGVGCDRCGKVFYTTGELTRHRCRELIGL